MWQLQNGSFGNPNTYFEPNRPVNVPCNGNVPTITTSAATLDEAHELLN